MRVSFRSRCPAGDKRTRNRRACVTPHQDAYQPYVIIEVLESSDDFPAEMQRPDGPVKLPPEVAAAYARAILRAVDHCLEGH